MNHNGKLKSRRTREIDMSAAPYVLSGLSVQVAGVILRADVDEAAKTARVVQIGDAHNGNAVVIETVRMLLVQRVRRVHPGFRVS